MPEARADWPRQNPSSVAGDTVLPDRVAFRDVLRRTVEGELLPRILTQLRAGVPRASATSAAPGRLPRGAFQHFMGLVGERDESAMRRYLAELVGQGHDVDRIFDDLLTPAARRMGHLWESDDWDFMEVTLGCARLQRAVCRLGRMANEVGDGTVRGRVLIGGMYEDQHTLGGVLLAEVLTRDGWMVTLAPPFARGRPQGEYDLICFSLASSDRVSAAADRLDELRRRHGRDAKLILGGNAILRDPGLVKRLDGDGWAEDADGALNLARAFAPKHAHAAAPHGTADD